MRRSSLGSALIGLAVALLAGGSVALAQDPDAGAIGRGPQFLLASARSSERPVAVDVASVPVLRRRLSLDLEDVGRAEALDAISKASGLRLVYANGVSLREGRVRLKADQITVAAALTEVLLDAGVDVLLARSGDAVLVKRMAVEAPAVGSIVGRVTDAKTQTALAGATVLVEGTRHSATTGNDGRYRIADVAPATYTLRARFIGYAPGSTSVTVSADQEATADFGLEKSAQRLDEVVTTGTIVETEIKSLPSPITVITADQIREQNITRVDQLFRGEIPGVFAFDEGNGDDVSRIFVRGGSDLFALGTIKTYVDGVELANSSSFLSTIDPNSIERMELIRGPQASTLYGSEALSGVLQIFTKRGLATARPVISGQFAGGAIQTQWVSQSAVPTYRGNLNISGGSGTFSYNIGAGRLYKGEWVSEYRDAENNLYGSMRGTQGWFSIELSGRLQYQNRGYPNPPLFQSLTSAPSLSKPQLTDLNYQSTGLSVVLRAQPILHWQQTLTLGTDRLLQEFVQRAPRFTTPDDTLLNTYSSDHHQLTFLYTTALEGALARALTGNLTAGVNVTSAKSAYFSVNSAQNTGNLNPAGVGALGRLVAADRGYFAQGQLGIADALFLTAGLRAEDNDNYGQNYGLAWAPRVGASYVWSLGGVMLKARASYGKSIRAPSASERDGAISTSVLYLPNPSIGPESQRGVDVGLELYAGRSAMLQATYYNQTAGDLIDQVLITLGAVPTYQYQNIGEIKNRGLELEGSLSPWPWVTVSGTYAITKSTVQRLSPAYRGQLQVGDQLLAVPQHTGGANARLTAGKWTAHLGFVYSGSWIETDLARLYTDYFVNFIFTNPQRSYWITYPAFIKGRLALSRRIGPSLTAFVNVENFTNSYATEQANFYVTPGRTTAAGVNFQF